MTLTLVASGTRPWSSAWKRSGMLGNMVVPPDMTTLPRRSLRTSRSQSLTVLSVSWRRPGISRPSRAGLNMSSGQRICWAWTSTEVPSGHLELLGLVLEVGHLGVVVLGDVAELLLHLLGSLLLGGGGEGDLGVHEDLAHPLGEVAASEVDALDGVGHGVTLVDGHGVRDTVTAVNDNTSGTAGGVERKHGLDGDVEPAHVEGLEHDLGHLLAVLLGVHGGLGEEDATAVLVIGVLLADNHAELVVEGVAPDLLHVVPVVHDTVVQGVLEEEDTALLLGLLTDVEVLLGTDKGRLALGVANDGGEGHLGGVLSGAAGLHHAGTVVDDNGGLLISFVTHAGLL